MRCIGAIAWGQGPWGKWSMATSMACTTVSLSTVRRIAMPWIGWPAAQRPSPGISNGAVLVSRSSASMSHRPSSRR